MIFNHPKRGFPDLGAPLYRKEACQSLEIHSLANSGCGSPIRPPARAPDHLANRRTQLRPGTCCRAYLDPTHCIGLSGFRTCAKFVGSPENRIRLGPSSSLATADLPTFSACMEFSTCSTSSPTRGARRSAWCCLVPSHASALGCTAKGSEDVSERTIRRRKWRGRWCLRRNPGEARQWRHGTRRIQLAGGRVRNFFLPCDWSTGTCIHRLPSMPGVQMVQNLPAFSHHLDADLAFPGCKAHMNSLTIVT